MSDAPDTERTPEQLFHTLATRPALDPSQMLARLACAVDDEQAQVRPAATPAKKQARAFAFQRSHIAALAAATCVVAVAGITVARMPSAGEPVVTHRTQTGEQRTITLRDGSRVTLAPQSQLVVQQGYGDARRSLVLQGEAYFEVAADHAVPFTVQAGTVTTRVLGTAFNIHHYTDDTIVRVAVVQGKVSLFNTKAQLTLSGGEIGEATDSVVQHRARDGAANTVRWMRGELIFDDTPVPALLSALERWYGYRFQLADSSLAKARVSAVFQTGKPDETLLALADVLDVSVRVEGRTITLQQRRKPAAIILPRDGRRHTAASQREVGK